MRERGRLRKAAIAIAALAAMITLAFLAYVGDYYRAGNAARAALAGSDNVEVVALDDGSVAFVPGEASCGLVFYPGGKVEPEAYAPLMLECAERGVLCVLLEPTFNLAILDRGAADGVVGQFPGVENWLVGGHSLGGVVASSYLAGHAEEFEGLVLLAAYPTADLSDSSEQVLSLVGSNDRVLDREAYESARKLLPAGTREVVIDGGNHAQFGDYGAQDGDGTAAISPQEQTELAADAIAELAEQVA